MKSTKDTFSLGSLGAVIFGVGLASLLGGQPFVSGIVMLVGVGLISIWVIGQRRQKTNSE